MHRWLVVLALAALTLLSCKSVAANNETVRLTILYDNYAHDDRLTTDWGFSCWIEGLEKTILFDAGYRPHVFFENVEALGLDVREIDVAILSHGHGDHYGGLSALADLGLPLVVPMGLPTAARLDIGWPNEDLIYARGSYEICPGARTTGQLTHPLPEHSLVLQTDLGLIVVTGCAHPGVVDLVELALDAYPGESVHLVVGGFHLGGSSREDISAAIADLQQLGVRHVAPTHCTGDLALNLFRRTYGENFFGAGIGATFEFEL